MYVCVNVSMDRYVLYACIYALIFEYLSIFICMNECIYAYSSFYLCNVMYYMHKCMVVCYMYLFTLKGIYVREYSCVYVYINVYMYVFMYVCTNACMYICMYLCIYVCMYVRI